MTNREKAIVMAHTGICMLEGEKLGVFYQYLNELYGRPVYTHEWVTLDIKEKSKPDFLQLCKEEEPERRGRWIPDFNGKFKGGAYWFRCSRCGRTVPDVRNGGWDYCPSCGADMREKKNECDTCFIPMFYNLEDDDSICRDCEVGE